MPPTQGICSVFKQALLAGTHNFTTSTGNSFKIALVTSSSTISASTINYAAISNEHANSGGYTTTGLAMTNASSMPGLTSTTAFASWNNALWSSSTITARGALIYNDTASGDPSVCVLDFGSDKSSSSGDFTVQFPTADSSTAIIRIL